MSKITLKKLRQRGDTIVEVLICLAVAGSALTICYGISRRSLSQIQDAHERGEMLSMGQAEIERLQQYIKLRDPTFSTFDGPTERLFCITEDLDIRTVPLAPISPRNTTCAVDAAGNYLPDTHPNYGSSSDADADIVDLTHPYRSAIVFHPQNTASEVVNEFYVLSGRFKAGGSGRPFSVVTLMYRQHP